MGETAQQKKDRLEALAVQKEQNALLRESNELKKADISLSEKSAGLNKSNLNSIKDWSNVLNSILKNEEYSLQEKTKQDLLIKK